MEFFLIILLLLLLTIISIICIFFMLQIIAIFTTDAPFVPIPGNLEDKIVETLKLDDKSVLYDLGCGDARILMKAIQKHPSIKAIGIEKGHYPYFLAKFRTRDEKNIEIRWHDIYTAPVGDATHIFLYLFPKVMNKLFPILKRKCKPGTRIVSCDFEFEGVIPTEIIDMEEKSNKRGKRLIVYTT